MGSESEGEANYEDLITAQNRKRKLAGGWQALGLDSNVYRAVQKKGYKAPTPIQRKAIPVILDGKDVVAMARTGSGKTAAFLVPIFQKLKCRCARSGARVLIISPTRELALQTFKFTKELGKYTGTRAAVVVGGDSLEEQFGAIHENPDVLLATPGRLLHVVMEMNLKLSSVELVVFDEADRLFEMGFAEQLKEVLCRLPDGRQTLLFSATLPKMLVDFARAGLNQPVLIRLDVDSKISDDLDLVFVSCRVEDKLALFLFLLRGFLSDGQTIVFCATKHHVEWLKMVLDELEIPSSYLYSSLDPVARKINIAKFRNKETGVLVVTDVAARGVDIPLLDHAVNFHFPAKPKLFVHRVGRVARAGRSGRAWCLVSPDEIPHLLDLFLFLGRPLKVASSNQNYDAKEWNSLIGSAPQSIVDFENESLYTLINSTEDFIGQQKVVSNGMKHYLKSRPGASTESVRRAKKEKDLSSLADCPGDRLHPIFEGGSEDKEKSALLNGIKNYKPQVTIFELNAGHKDERVRVMKDKRRKHQKWVVGRPKGAEPVEPAHERVEDKAPEEEIQATFSSVIGASKWRVSDGDRKRKGMAQRKEEQKRFFVPARPQDFHTEQGLAVDGGRFDKQTRQAVLDFTADEAGDMRRHKRQQLIWDRKKKKFVGKDGERVKKIQTESGALIPASYKADRYEKWAKKQRLDEQDEEPRQAKAGNMKKGGKSELKTKEQILKQRKRKQKIQSYQKYRTEQRNKGGKGKKH